MGRFSARRHPLLSARASRGSRCFTCVYDPSDELLRFDGPKLWFTIEPSWHPHFHSHPVGKRLVRELDASERAYYAHPDATHRIPHPTYGGSLSRPRLAAVRHAAVATVN